MTDKKTPDETPSGTDGDDKESSRVEAGGLG
jgi:hypothetical protein